MAGTIDTERSPGPAPLGPATHRARARPGVVLAVASIGVFMAFVDDTVVAIAFPNMVRSFHDAKLSELSWVLNAYNIAFAALLVPAGRFADQLGRRRMYVTGLVLFTLASAGAATAQSIGWLIAARAVQGLGSALIVPASLAIVLHAHSPQKRAQAVTIWSAAAALAAGIGPSIGGALVNADSWRLVFIINLPIGAGAIWLSRRQLVQSRAPGQRLSSDLTGALLLAITVAALTLAIVQGPDWGWASAGVILAGGVTALGAAALARRTTRSRSPIIDLELVRTSGFAATSVLTIVGAAGFFSLGVANVLFLIEVWGYSPLTTGLATTPAPFVAAAVAGLAAQLAKRVDARRLVLIGAAAWTMGPLFLLARADAHPNYLGVYLPAAILAAIGVGLAYPLVSDAAVAIAPRGRYAGATGLNVTIRQVGAAIGVAILTALLGHSVRSGTVHVYHGAWIFAAGCFAAVGLGSFFMTPFVVPDLDDEAELDRRRTALRAAAADARPVVRRAPAAPAPMGPIVDDDRFLLAEVAMFADLSSTVREALAARARSVHLGAGDWLFRQGDPADALYVVRHGRLEVLLRREDGVVERLQQLGRGSVVGELALLSEGKRAASIRARRDASLLRLDREMFDEMLGEASFAAAVARALGAQLRGTRRFDAEVQPSAKTIAVVRGLHEQRAGVLEAELVRTLAGLRSVVSLDRTRVSEVAPDVELGAALAQVLDRVEARHELVLLSAPAAAPDGWLHCCLRQADRVILILDGDIGAWSAEAELELLRGCDVVLLESPERPEIAQLLDRLDPRSTHRVRAPADIWRLARRIAERAVGLVLSGGGARAFAHIGVIAELHAAGVSIDRIGGASMGAFIGALVAQDMPADEIEARCYHEFVRRNPLGDYRFPRTSLVRGARAQAMLERNLPGLIEDLPRSYFCVTADIISARLCVHRRGELVPAVGASMAIPGVAPPVAIGQRLLVDGGVLDNLPIMTMRDEHEGPIIASDVTQAEQRMLAPGEAPPRIGLIDTLARVMLLGTTDTEALGRRYADVMITPDRGSVGRLEFHMIDSMVDAGRRAALAALEDAPSSLFGS